MSDEEVLHHYEKMREIFGDELPDPEHEPVRFAYFVKVYKYYHVPHWFYPALPALFQLIPHYAW